MMKKMNVKLSPVSFIKYYDKPPSIFSSQLTSATFSRIHTKLFAHASQSKAYQSPQFYQANKMVASPLIPTATSSRKSMFHAKAWPSSTKSTAISPTGTETPQTSNTTERAQLKDSASNLNSRRSSFRSHHTPGKTPDVAKQALSIHAKIKGLREQTQTAAGLVLLKLHRRDKPAEVKNKQKTP